MFQFFVDGQNRIETRPARNLQEASIAQFIPTHLPGRADAMWFQCFAQSVREIVIQK